MEVTDLNKEAIISLLKEHKQFLGKKFGITKIALFGSYVRNEQKPTSDIDLAIETNDFSFDTLCDLKHFLEEQFKKPVDICYFDGMRSFIRQEIEKELIYA